MHFQTMHLNSKYSWLAVLQCTAATACKGASGLKALDVLSHCVYCISMQQELRQSAV
jgi:hypothetical protein